MPQQLGSQQVGSQQPPQQLSQQRCLWKIRQSRSRTGVRKRGLQQLSQQLPQQLSQQALAQQVFSQQALAQQVFSQQLLAAQQVASQQELAQQPPWPNMRSSKPALALCVPDSTNRAARATRGRMARVFTGRSPKGEKTK